MTLEIITSELLHDVKHGFFSRKGGASSGVFEGLNCGVGSSDQSDMVQINRNRVSNEMGVEPETLVTVHQTHSTRVHVANGRNQGALPQADAIVSKTAGIALGVLTADCQPVLFADTEAGVVAAAHAGWRGALDGMLEETIDAMVTLGAVPHRIRAVIGPSISQRAYEVGPEFFERFADEDPAYSQYFANGERDRMLFDLPGFGLHRLRNAGVTAEWTGHCTYSDPDRFFSYRRSVHSKQADYGRLISSIRL